MKKFTILIVLLGLFTFEAVNAQRKLTGTVTSAQDNKPVVGATVSVKSTTIGTLTDVNGKYELQVPEKYTTLVISFVGLKTQEITIGTSNEINVLMQADILHLDELVVTALGISREKKSLGYATQEVSGADVTTVQTDNFINNLSGKVSGLQITRNTNMGGSTNIIIRGNKSLNGTSQALFVIDGVPVANTNSNTGTQVQGEYGYDFGNAASDINPDDIESINVLKGAAATALYGSRAANGVIMITTKKGQGAKTATGAIKKGIGVEINSGFQFGVIDKSTFPKYQKDYGAGYGSYWNTGDVNGDGVDDNIAPTGDDASCGFKFDPNLYIYQWDAFYPESPNYHKATPWVAAKNGPIDFFENPTTFTNSIAIENSMDNGSYRFAYTKYKENGLMPNSDLQKDNILVNGVWKVNNKLTATGSASYNRTAAIGRNSTGYYDNLISSFRQWMQTNVDVKQLKDAYFTTKRNITWNWADPFDPAAGPGYWDNYYFTRYQNFESDNRNRFLGYISLDYKVNDWLSLFGRASGDTYFELQEERRAVGSVATTFGIGTGADGSYTRPSVGSGYLRRDYTFSEYNYDLMANIKKNLTKDLNLTVILGTNIRKSNYTRMINATNGGLVVPELYSLQNSVDALPLPKELKSRIAVDGIYASASLGYKSMLYFDATIRRDQSSTLPKDNNSYYYPSVSGSFIFSALEALKKYKWLSYGKVRLNYAEVGNSAPFDQLVDIYNIVTPFNSPIFTVPTTKKNSELKPERTRSAEGGLEMNFLENRIGFDIALYNTNSIDQIMPLAVSTASGYTYKYINAGKIENKGIELSLKGTPIKIKDFQWDIAVNWGQNRNKVKSLIEGVDNLQLGSFQGGVTINARVGQPYGVIQGTDYVYIDGEKVVDPETGQYLFTETSDQVIGNMNPKWNGGVLNTLTYKNWSLTFLIDVQHGGDIYSLDRAYGLETGIYAESSYTNDLGNPVRDPITWVDDNDHSKGYASNSGGTINKGVNPDGSVNKTRIEVNPDANGWGLVPFGESFEPSKGFVYDASYIKLREVAISYKLPSSLFKKFFITGATVSVVGSNLWIIHKNLPYADPESGLSAGNLQGYSSAPLPTTHNFGFNLKLNF